MIYCHDCGAANDRGHPTCRVCGRALQIQRSTLKCSACSQFIGVGAAFCSSCGASADDIALGAIADGGVPPNEDAVEALLAAPVVAAPRSAAASPAPPSEDFNIGAGLDLPDWLKRAAAEHPPVAADHATNHDARPAGAASVAGASEAGGQAGAPAQAMAVPTAMAATAPVAPTPPVASPAVPEAAPPLPPIPDGGLAATMPAWLRPGTGPAAASAGRGPSPSPEPLRPRVELPTPSLAEDPTDTTSFISEKDLPDWLRQIAEADAAREQEARRADEAARVAAAQAAEEAASQAAETPPEAGATATVEPAEALAPGGAAGRWLSRRDSAEAAGSGRRSAFADLIQEQESVQEAVAETATPPAARPAAAPAAPSWDAPAQQPHPAAEARGGKRWLFLGLLLLIVAALLAYLYATGQFG